MRTGITIAVVCIVTTITMVIIAAVSRQVAWAGIALMCVGPLGLLSAGFVIGRATNEYVIVPKARISKAPARKVEVVG